MHSGRTYLTQRGRSRGRTAGALRLRGCASPEPLLEPRDPPRGGERAGEPAAGTGVCLWAAPHPGEKDGKL